MSKYDKMSTHELVAKRADYRPSHVLHLLLSVITAGLWLLVWFFVALSHRNERNKIDQVLRSRE
jgi:hypothetical protein